MRKLSLYPEGRLPPAAVSQVEPLEPDPGCERCTLGHSVKKVCMPSKGKSGGLYVIGAKPTKLEEAAGKLFYAQYGLQFRKMLEKVYAGPVVFDNAIRCAAGIMDSKIKPKMLTACRPFTAGAIAKRMPQRIICLGSEASFSILGRRMAQVRRAYGWIEDQDGFHIPVFVLPNISFALKNRFQAKQFEEDLAWAVSAKVEPWFLKAKTLLIENEADAKLALGVMESSTWFTYDVETSGHQHNPDFKIETITLLGDKAKFAYTWTREAMQDDACRDVLAECLNAAPSTTQNGKYDDRSVLLDLKCHVQVIHYDTRLGRKLLDPDQPADLGSLADTVGAGEYKARADAITKPIKAELKRLANPPQGLTKTGKKRKIKPPAFNVPSSILNQVRGGSEPDAFMFHFVAEKPLYRYNAMDVFCTREVTKTDYPKLQAHPTIHRAWDMVVKDANKAIRYMENWGVPVDRTAIESLGHYCDVRIAEAEKQMRTYTDVNPASPVQLAKYLFDELGLESSEQTDSGARSTDAGVLESLKDQHPYVAHLLEHRKMSKFRGTYAYGMLGHIRADNRIHTSFLLDGAGTGRLSSQGPNLQNIPRAKGSVLGTMARNCFIAQDPNYVLLEADFAQQELRVAAMLSGDETMIADFKAGIDIHRNGARECCEIVWKIPRAKWDKMTKDEQDPYRSQIKTTIFGRLYGKTDSGLAREFGCSVKTVEAINKTIWGRYKKLQEFMDNCTREARKTGVAWTWWDGARARVRPIPKIADQDQGMRSHYERVAGNTPIQGTGAEFMTASLWPIVDWINSEKVKAQLILTVHDSMMLNVHKKVVDEAARQVRRVMLSHNSLGVPLGADFKIGHSWGAMSDYKVKEAA